MSERCPKCGRTQTRSTEANRRLWALYNLISENIGPEGKRYSPDTWHLYFKGLLLGCTDIELPNGRVRSEPNSTAKLSTSEFNDFMTQIEQWASERKVYLPE